MRTISLSLLFVILGTSLSLNAANKDTKMEPKSAASPKIAVVDVRRIISHDPEGLKNGSEEWKDLFTKLQETLKPSQKEITDLKTQIEKKGNELQGIQASKLITPDQFQRKVDEEFTPLQIRYQRAAEQYQRFEAEEFAKIQQTIGPKIEKVFNSIRSTQGWDIILHKEMTLGSINPRFDITQEVLELLNKQYALEKAKKAEPKKS